MMLSKTNRPVLVLPRSLISALQSLPFWQWLDNMFHTPTVCQVTPTVFQDTPILFQNWRLPLLTTSLSSKPSLFKALLFWVLPYRVPLLTAISVLLIMNVALGLASLSLTHFVERCRKLLNIRLVIRTDHAHLGIALKTKYALIRGDVQHRVKKIKHVPPESVRVKSPRGADGVRCVSRECAYIWLSSMIWNSGWGWYPFNWGTKLQAQDIFRIVGESPSVQRERWFGVQVCVNL